jgi:hypothetical protein
MNVAELRPNINKANEGTQRGGNAGTMESRTETVNEAAATSGTISGNMTTTPEYTTEAWGTAMRRTLRTFKGLFRAFCWFGGIALVALFALVGYEQLDLNGYISHERTLDVYIASNWLVGENRICWLRFQLDANGKPTNTPERLECPVGDEKLQAHNITVTFKGVIDPVDINGKPRTVADLWKCTREGDGFICVPMAYPVKPVTSSP